MVVNGDQWWSMVINGDNIMDLPSDTQTWFAEKSPV